MFTNYRQNQRYSRIIVVMQDCEVLNSPGNLWRRFHLSGNCSNRQDEKLSTRKIYT